MLRCNDLGNHDFDPVNPQGDLLTNIAWVLRLLTHSMLNATPGQVILNSDMLFDLEYVADQGKICQCKEKQIQKDNERENSKRREQTYKVGGKVLLKRDHLHILRKTQLLNNGPFVINEVNDKRGTLSITDIDSGTTLNVSIRRVRPFYER